MSSASHSSMYKSKSGSHFGDVSHHDLKQNVKNEERKNYRFRTYQQNRNIAQTPKNNPIEPEYNEEIVNLSAETGKKTELPVTKISRQQIFRQRFQQYLYKKEEQKQTKLDTKVKPFVSAVVKGRFIDASKEQGHGNKKAVAMKSKERKNAVNLAICETPKFSPINTRSKNLALWSPLEMSQTPSKRKIKNRKPLIRNANPKTAVERALASNKSRQIKKADPKVNNVQKKTFTVLSSNKSLKEVNKATSSSYIGTIKKDAKLPIQALSDNKNIKTASKTTSVNIFGSNGIHSKYAAKAMLPANKIIEQPKLNQIQESNHRNIAKPIRSNKKPNVHNKHNMEIPKNFNFQRAGFVGIVSSTVSKSKKFSSLSSGKIFNENISPIENTAEDQQQIPNENVSPPMKLSNVENFSTKSKGNKNENHPEYSKNQGTEKRNTQANTPENPAQASNFNYVSPFVTISRGAYNKRKEKEINGSKYALESRKSRDLNDSIESRQNKEAATYFRGQMQRETDRFERLVDTWKKYIAENCDLPSEYTDQIDVAIGQTGLLTTSKFKQFSKLIDQCECNDEKVKPKDLEGFWSMIYLQVENCNQRFERLEKLKKCNWDDPELHVVKKKKIRAEGITIIKNKPTITKRPNSALSEMLKLARQKHIDNKTSKHNANTIDDVLILTKRKSVLGNIQTDNFIPHRVVTPQKSLWIVSFTIGMKIFINKS